MMFGNGIITLIKERAI